LGSVTQHRENSSQWLFVGAAATLGVLWIAILSFMRGVEGRWTNVIGVPEVTALLLATQAVYLIACHLALQLKHFKPSARAVAAAGLLFRLTMLPAGPTLTDDLWRYQWEGRIQAEGRNPYATRPADLGNTAVPGKDFRAVYGPLAEFAEQLTWRISTWAGPASSVTGGAAQGADPRPGVRWMKLPAMVADLAVILVIARVWPDRLLIYAWSPVAILEFWGQGHNDALAVLMVTMALAWRPAGLFLGLAAAAKWWPLVLVPALARSWRDWLLAPLTVLVCVLPYAAGLSVENLRFTTGFLGGWRNNDSLFGLLLALTPDQYRAKHLAFAIVAAAGLAAGRWPEEWLRVLRGRIAGLPQLLPESWDAGHRGLFVVVTMLAVSSNVHPWYLSWTVPFLVLVPVPAVFLWGALMPIAYEPVLRWTLLGEWGSSGWARWAIYVPVAAVGILCPLLKWAASRDLKSEDTVHG
jgi:hypothetical protein